MRAKLLLFLAAMAPFCTRCMAQDSRALEVLEIRSENLIASIPVITKAEHVKQHIGRIVAVRGIVSDTKLTRILGVELKAASDLRGKEAYAVGVLQRVVVAEGNPSLPNDGPGEKLILYANLQGELAEARPLPMTPKATKESAKSR